MNKYSYRYHDLLVGLLYEINTVAKYFSKKAKYQHLIQELKKYNVNGEVTLPKQKELLNSLRISRPQLVDQMNELYQDFKYRLMHKSAYQVTKKEIWLLIDTTDGESLAIGLDNLEHLPRENEQIYLPFIKRKLTAGYFNVAKVDHEISENKHTINIFVDNCSDKHYPSI